MFIVLGILDKIILIKCTIHLCKHVPVNINYTAFKKHVYVYEIIDLGVFKPFFCNIQNKQYNFFLSFNNVKTKLRYVF